MRTIFSVKRQYYKSSGQIDMDEKTIHVAPSQMLATGTREHSHVQVFQVSERGHNLEFMDGRGVAIQTGGEGKKYKDFSEAIEDIKDGFYGAFVEEVNSVESHS